MAEINKEGLRKFILDASRATYASGDSSLRKKQEDGSTTIEFEDSGYKFHDNYFGGEPYGGREVIFLNGKSIWMMVYYGLVHPGTEAKEVYPFLTESLSQATLEMPYRGPAVYEKGLWKYENELKGDLESLSGTERIKNQNKVVYEASYIGGLIDQ